ncbi:hypothetical protein J2046_006440 [Rhizobium petrolearium]|nr:hypothetical protein [Neorhizobium petrolearium]
MRKSRFTEAQIIGMLNDAFVWIRSQLASIILSTASEASSTMEPKRY